MMAMMIKRMFIAGDAPSKQDRVCEPWRDPHNN